MTKLLSAVSGEIKLANFYKASTSNMYSINQPMVTSIFLDIVCRMRCEVKQEETVNVKDVGDCNAVYFGHIGRNIQLININDIDR